MNHTEDVVEELQRRAPARICTRLGIVAICMLVPGALSAAEVDVTSGHRIATESCAGCHAVEPNDAPSPVARAPAFEAIAQNPATTHLSLSTFLVTSHPSMPNIRLQPGQADDVIDYILSLRHR